MGYSFPWDIADGQWDSEGQGTSVSISKLAIVGINCCNLRKSYCTNDVNGDTRMFISQGAF